MSVRIEFTVPDDFHERIESARGSVPRATFIKDLIARGLDGGALPSSADARIRRATDVSRGDAAARRQAKLNAAKYGAPKGGRS